MIGRGRSGTAPRAGIQLALVCATTVALSLVLIAMMIAMGALTGIASRDAARMPVLALDSGEHPIGFALDTYAAPPLNIVLVQPGTSPGKAPPGIREWPRPGTAYVSPFLLHHYPVGATSPWGVVVGPIEPSGLANLNEQFVYANPRNYVIPEDYAVGHWGAPKGFSGDNRSNHPLWQFIAVMTIMLLAPAVYAVRTATGMRSPRLQRALDIFEGLGAPATFRVQVAVASIALPVSIALILCETLVAAMLLNTSDVPLGFAGVIVQHRDVLAVGWWLVAAPVGAAVITFALAIWGIRASKAPQRTPTFVERSDKSRLVLASAAPVAALLLTQVGSVDWFPVEVLAALALLLVAVVLFTTPFFISGLARPVLWLWRHLRRTPTVRVATRCGESSTRTFELIAAGIVVAISMLGVVALYGGYYGQQTIDSLHANDTIGRRILLARAPIDTPWTSSRLAQHLNDPDVMVLPIQDTQTQPSDPPGQALHLTCDQAAALRARACQSTTTQLQELHSPVLDSGAAFLPEQIRIDTAPYDSPESRFVVASRTGAPLDVDALRAAGFADQIRFAQLGDEWAGITGFNQHQMRWLTIFAVPGVVLLMAGLVQSSMVATRRRLDRLAGLRVFDPRRRLVWTAGAACLLLPLLLSVLIGSAAYATLAVVLGQLYEGLRLSVDNAVVLGVTASGAALLFWAVAMWTYLLDTPVRSPTFQDR